ncbi:hypothetical protein QBZ16_004098 [Prototheca wickerhamii]|uniref:Uncharacterized protein n=1 Tax=Prototheca wickerhamii TaxID=3111 RepID=A0AAD9IGU0_PROWI|nr:hypothetical protein QBZ16_004098 [Prototheca wickerhamii]
MASVEKRKADDGAAGGGEDAKRPKLGENGSAASKLNVKLEALARAKQALQRQKELLEARKKQQQQQQEAAGSAPAAPPASASAAAPTAPPAAPPTNLAPAEKETPTEEPEPEQGGAFFDPELGQVGRLERRRRGALQFVEEGEFQRQAEAARLRAKYGEGVARQQAARRAAEAAALAAAPGDANAWWDARVLADKTSYGAAAAGEPALRRDRVTALVEHPAQVDPPGEAPPPAPQPLKLTKRELKKMRTQRRLAREQEKQELIRQGLLEPAPNKVKLSNLSRVLGEQAAADPTAIETEAAHEDRNLARKLTPAEAKEKKLRKLLADESGDPTTPVSIYKVGALARPQLRFKVSINAQENHMTGVGLACEQGDFALVVVEGPPKAQRRYEKLMLRRIDWAAADDEEEEEAMATDGAQRPNYCRLVWQGTVLEPSFRKFRIETVKNDAAAKAFLQQYKLEHYWDLAEASQET